MGAGTLMWTVITMALLSFTEGFQICFSSRRFRQGGKERLSFVLKQYRNLNFKLWLFLLNF